MSGIVEQFLNWARRAPVDKREEAARALARSYLVSPVSPQEREQLEAAMTVLLDDRATAVRRALAEELAHDERAPEHVILTLAADTDSVAAIVAAHSPLILDSELVDMTAVRSEDIQVAIASRPFLLRAVSAALGEVATMTGCRALIENRGARIPRFTLDRIVARFGDCPEMRLTLIEREDLPLDVREVLLGKLADALHSLIISHEWLAPQRADIVIREAHECATIAASFEAPAENMPALFLMRAVASGQRLLFESALSALAGVPRERVGVLIASGRNSSLRALLQKAGLPRRTFPAFTAAIDVIRSGAYEEADSDYRRATQLIDAIVGRYQQRQDRERDQILMLLRRFAREARRAAARDFAEELMEAA